jgi:hypothetical protein
MPDPTDYHKATRDAIAKALGDLALGPPVVVLDDVDQISRWTSVPAILVSAVGPEQSRPELGTNQRDGWGLMSLVMLASPGVPNGAQSPGVPTITGFRRQVRVTFHNKRLTAVPEVGWCEVSDSDPLVDHQGQRFQWLSTALVVTAVGRFPRS